jgi:TOBE domain-containing protein
VTLCIRPHALAIAAAGGDTAVGYRENGTNRIAGTVLRETYLGDARDYLIDLRGSTPCKTSGKHIRETPSSERPHRQSFCAAANS